MILPETLTPNNSGVRRDRRRSSLQTHCVGSDGGAVQLYLLRLHETGRSIFLGELAGLDMLGIVTESHVRFADLEKA